MDIYQECLQQMQGYQWWIYRQDIVGYKWSTVSAHRNLHYLLVYHAIKLHIHVYIFHEES